MFAQDRFYTLTQEFNIIFIVVSSESKSQEILKFLLNARIAKKSAFKRRLLIITLFKYEDHFLPFKI